MSQPAANATGQRPLQVHGIGSSWIGSRAIVMIVGHLAEAIKDNAAGIQAKLYVGKANWDKLVARVERQETNPEEDFYDEQIWTFLVGCGYALPSAGATQLAHMLVGEEQSTPSSKIWFETLPKSPRVKEGSTNVDLALGAIRVRSDTRSGIEFDRATGDWVAFCECKWYSDIGIKVDYDQHRNQLLRTIENVAFFQHAGTSPTRIHVVLITPASFKERVIKSRLYQYKLAEYQSNPRLMLDELKACRLSCSASYAKDLNERILTLKLHWVTYQDLLLKVPESVIQESLCEFVKLSDRSHEHC
jgi:hypothetical protein